MLLLLFTALFAARVAGQAMQHWMPQSYLPGFAEFQGSNLPYGVLLASQLVILVLMTHYALRVRRGALAASRRAGVILGWLGGAYMTGAIARIAVGLAVPAAPPWFTAWIPAVLHVVLAAYVVTLAHYHGVESRARSGEEA